MRRQCPQRQRTAPSNAMLPVAMMRQGRFAAAAARSARALRQAVPGITLPAAHGASQPSRASTVAHASYQTSTPGLTSSPRVLVIGGGFGGLYAAIRLTQLFWPKGKSPQVTLVDKGERFTFKPLLYELLNNTATEDEVAPYFNQLLAAYPVQFVQDQVLSVQPATGSHTSSGQAVGSNTLPAGVAAGHVQLASGATLEYDWLVVALGSSTDSKGVPGVKELALPFNVYEDAVRVKNALTSIEQSGKPSSLIMVVGAGYAGVELATVLAERMRGKAEVRLVTPGADILDGCPEGQREAARKVLVSMGVSIMTGVRVTQLKPPTSPPGEALPTSCVADMRMPDGSVDALPVDLVLWSAGASPVTKDAQQRSGLPFPISARGSIQTEANLRVQGHERVFALGDVSGPEYSYEDQGTAAASSSSLPATAQVAFQQADYVAWNLWAAVNGRALLPFRYQHLGSMMSLGQLNAAVALPFALPRPLEASIAGSPLGPLLDAAGIKVGGGATSDSGVTLEGPLAAVLRRVAYLYRQPTNEQRLNVASSWVQQALSVVTNTGAPKS